MLPLYIQQLIKTAAQSPVSEEQARRAMDELDTLERNKPSAGQLARYTAIGAAAGPSVKTLGRVIESGPKGALGSPRRLAAEAVGGALTTGAIPLVRQHLERQVQKNTLKRYMGEQGQNKHGAVARPLPAAEAPAPQEGSNLARNVAVGSLAAAPFAGMIGQKSLKHDPTLGHAAGQRYKDLEELSRNARPGDVLALGKPEGGFFKHMIAPVAGSDFYHVQPVFGQETHNGITRGLTSNTGALSDYDLPHKKRIRNMQEDAPWVGGDLEKHKYHDVVLMRPKQKLTPAQQKVFNEQAMIRSAQPYDTTKAVSNWLKDLLVPKIKGVTDRGQQLAGECEGNICSTVTSQPFHQATGKSVVPGKAAQDVMPADFLRSDEFEPVGHHLSRKTKGMLRNPYQRAFQKAKPVLTRAGIGATLAGGAYATSEDPALGGAVVGAGAAGLTGHMLARHHLGERAAQALPSPNDLAASFMVGGSGADAKALRTHLGTRTVPLYAAGALAGYGGVKGLQHLWKKHKENKAVGQVAPAPEQQ